LLWNIFVLGTHTALPTDTNLNMHMQASQSQFCCLRYARLILSSRILLWAGQNGQILPQLRHYIIPVRAMDQPLRTPLYFPIPNRFGNGCGPTISGHLLDSVGLPKFSIPKMNQEVVDKISSNEGASASVTGETIPKEQEKLPWLQLFLEDQLCGLKCFEASVNRERKVEPLEHFAQCFLQLVDKHGDNIRDEVGFVSAYKHLQTLQGSREPSPTDLQIVARISSSIR